MSTEKIAPNIEFGEFAAAQASPVVLEAPSIRGNVTVMQSFGLTLVIVAGILLGYGVGKLIVTQPVGSVQPPAGAQTVIGTNADLRPNSAQAALLVLQPGSFMESVQATRISNQVQLSGEVPQMPSVAVQGSTITSGLAVQGSVSSPTSQ